MNVLPQFVDLAKTPKEVNEDVQSSPAMVSDVAAYPYGLCISLDQETLDKLDLEDSPNVGDMIHMHCLASVTSVSKREVVDPATGEKSCDCRIELQITGIALENESEENEEYERSMPTIGQMAKKAYHSKK